MARSNRQRKLAKAKRDARTAHKRDAARRRQEDGQAILISAERLGRIMHPDTPPREAADLLLERYSGEPVDTLLIARMRSAGSPTERLTAISAELLTGPRTAPVPGAEHAATPSLTALTFAAMAATDGDPRAARALLDQALEAADGQETWPAVVRLVASTGKIADAIALLEARLTDAPDDEAAAEGYGVWIEAAHQGVHEDRPGEPCPCGLGASWQECCMPAEKAALARFADRSGLVKLLDAVSEFLAASAYGRAVSDHVANNMSLASDLDWDAAELAALGELAAEAALLTAAPGEETDEIGESEPAVALDAFAAEPSVPTELADLAAAWRDHIHYGLWRIDYPHPAPGLWCTEIATGAARYVEFPAELAASLPRWAVWLGGIVPDRGIWRSTGTGVRLSPSEADAAAELIQAATESLVYELAGKPARAKRSVPDTLRIGRAEPHGVYADLADPAPPYTARLIGQVTMTLMPRIAVEVHQHRSVPPTLTNTDGDPMCLIKAQIKVRDTAQAVTRLTARTDFEPDDNDPARVTWYGREIPESQRAAMLAEAMSQLRAQGSTAEIEEPGRPQRWVRGTLQFEGGEAIAEVNSRERLSRLIDVLTRIGADPVITDEQRVDPAQDLAWPAGERGFAPSLTPPGEGWDKHWLDEKVPALRDRTPRQAAAGEERPLLEALLRQFEYLAGLHAGEGEAGFDTTWLRQELGMPSYAD